MKDNTPSPFSEQSEICGEKQTRNNNNKKTRKAQTLKKNTGLNKTPNKTHALIKR